MKKVFKRMIFSFLILIIPICVKAETVDVNSALLFKAYLSTGANNQFLFQIGNTSNPGSLEINGGTISGDTGIEVRTGKYVSMILLLTITLGTSYIFKK